MFEAHLVPNNFFLGVVRGLQRCVTRIARDLRSRAADLIRRLCYFPLSLHLQQRSQGQFSGVRESQAAVTRKVGGILRRRRSRATPRKNGSLAERIKHVWDSSFSERNDLQKKNPYCSEACCLSSVRPTIRPTTDDRRSTIVM